jgi:transcriptional regulator with XRE-family HTH domain
MKKEIEINRKIHVLRKTKGVSQEYMADKLGISQRAYSKIERSETHLTFERITEIASILGYTNWQIIALDENVILGKAPIPNDVVNFVPIELVKRIFDKYDLKIKLLEKELKSANETIASFNKV